MDITLIAFSKNDLSFSYLIFFLQILWLWDEPLWIFAALILGFQRAKFGIV